MRALLVLRVCDTLRAPRTGLRPPSLGLLHPHGFILPTWALATRSLSLSPVAAHIKFSDP